MLPNFSQLGKNLPSNTQIFGHRFDDFWASNTQIRGQHLLGASRGLLSHSHTGHSCIMSHFFNVTTICLSHLAPDTVRFDSPPDQSSPMNSHRCVVFVCMPARVVLVRSWLGVGGTDPGTAAPNSPHFQPCTWQACPLTSCLANSPPPLGQATTG